MCALHARTRGGGARFADVRWHDEVTSTNDEAALLALAGEPDGVVVVADSQSAGRGRRGRGWESPGGGESLLVSVVVRPVVPLLTLAAGLAVVDAVGGVAGVSATLKWPNDVLVDELKLAGLLAEVHGEPGRQAAVVAAAVVGLGLNLAWTGPLTAGACSLASLGAATWDRAVVLDAWLVALENRLAQDPAALLDHYRSACSTLGRRVRVETPSDTFEGTALDVDETGRLIIDDHHLQAGDVIHLR